ncbi:hypothetical protein BH11PSE8_BH11PSE8_11340 [soil metagenome]
MHLMIPFASGLSEAASHVLRDLALPNLSRLLARLTPAALDAVEVAGDEYSFSTPQERALASAWGWRGADGTLPFAAKAAAADGVAVGDLAWCLITPAHWHVGRDHVALVDPATLDLQADESRPLFEAVRDLFESEGFRLAYGAPTRWYGAHESLADLPCASLDRVIGRNVDLWIRHGPTAPSQTRLIRRLQSEVQLLLYPHAINDAREARGATTVNSFWLSGCGRYQPDDASSVSVDDTLRAPLLAEDWAAWAEAWCALDAGAIVALLARSTAGESVSLTLCGERRARRFDSAPRTLWQRLSSKWNAPEAHRLLETL